MTGAIRVDQSSVFGEDQRTQNYLKGSGSYVLSSADFWKNARLAGWWRIDMDTKACAEGYANQAATLWTPDGQLASLGYQVVAVYG